MPRSAWPLTSPRGEVRRAASVDIRSRSTGDLPGASMTILTQSDSGCRRGRASRQQPPRATQSLPVQDWWWTSPGSQLVASTHAGGLFRSGSFSAESGWRGRVSRRGYRGPQPSRSICAISAGSGSTLSARRRREKPVFPGQLNNAPRAHLVAQVDLGSVIVAPFE